MTTFYLDPLNGLDANSGLSWALAWKTITLGATAARIAPGDVVRIAKSPDPTSLGVNGSFGVMQPGTYAPVRNFTAIASSTNAGPIQITTSVAHGLASGDIVGIWNHAVNTNANGVWTITYVSPTQFTLDESVGNGIGVATGSVQYWSNKVIKLSTPLVIDIDNCDKVWTAATANYTVTVAASTFVKEGFGSMKCVAVAGAVVEKMCYRTLPATLDLSGYQQVSFWIYNSVALAAGDMQIRLCSDATGDTPVNTISIPAIPSINRWIAFTVDTGGALGSAIASISLYQAVDKGVITIYLDNIIACKASSSADSLSLISLISKNSQAQGGTDPWLPIKCIVRGKMVVIDQDPTDLFQADASTRGSWGYYSAVAETVPVYKRECFRLVGTVVATIVAQIMDSGTWGNLIEYQGGYDTTLNTQIGETFFDGGNGFGYGLYGALKNYIKINHLNYARYSYGIYSTDSYMIIDNIQSVVGCATKGIYLLTGAYNTINNILNACCNAGQGIHIDTSVCNIGSLLNINCNTSDNITAGVDVSAEVCFLQEVSARGNGFAVNIGSEIVIRKLTTGFNRAGGLMASLYPGSVTNWLDDAGSYICGGASLATAKIYCQNLARTAGNHWIYTFGGTINLQTLTKYTTAAWKFAITDSSHNIYYPIWMPLIRLQVANGVLSTVKCWVKKDDLTVMGQLVCRGGQVAGVLSDVVAIKSNDLNWEQLQIQITPSEDGIVTIEGWAYWNGSGTSPVYFDSTLEVT